ncbi:hypothetical protein ONA91_37775 [Micromonospora sp. DR5-3]|uniref:hypothetical protein n=1 Tax=unclassified Micromonospora TaxID=2617518 RepID=UPI0011D3B1C9|nr:MULTISPECIES: hypothetical protein [unclassified Micromonospora]MCW3820195.1 hypothetical protein [Micromonospora sp. DR5-3]TYC19503.1 hypothetical protein FXF52_36255 [Micromonospora sp. MP36]
MTEAGPTLSLRDVAQLAGVQRSVVSMWRRRPQVRGRHIPFPDPVTPAGAVERFARDEIVDWLTRTGRGNNPEHRLDAPALSVPADASLEDLVTLLCLHAHGDSDLADLTSAERERLAQLSDPRDEFLLTEVQRLAATDEMLRFVDDLVEASRGLPEALARLDDGPAGRELGRRDLTVEAMALVGAIVQAGILHLDPNGVPIAFADGPSSLALAIASGNRLLISGTGAAERALRRRAFLNELDVVNRADGALLRVLAVLELEGEAALERVDDLLLDLGPNEVAVVIGPAGTLCERLRGDAERFRATMLRLGHMVAAVRLPRGMWRRAHRQALGLWVCAGGLTANRPMVGDLSAHPSADLSMEDLAADVSAALSGDTSRAFRYLRGTDLPVILTGSPIVPAGVRAARLSTSSDNHLTRAQSAALVVAEPLPPLDVLLTAAPGAILLRQRSLGELHEAGILLMRRGCRIDPQHAVPDGSILVLSADGSADGVALDPFDAARLYPRAHRTEPGDVVFMEGSRPCARVDEHGNSLVASPSRLLRLRPAAGVGPHTLAAIINHQPATSEWRTWSIPVLDRASGAALESALVDASAYGAALRQRQDALHDLITALIDGVAAGAVSVVLPGNTEEGQ